MVRGSMRLFAIQGACGLVWLNEGEKPPFSATKDSVLAERRPFRPGTRRGPGLDLSNVQGGRRPVPRSATLNEQDRTLERVPGRA